jgi:sterol desaturase/sphingolipid hydroxylase (fatty acid hydroxylase superfamily)
MELAQRLPVWLQDAFSSLGDGFGHLPYLLQSALLAGLSLLFLAVIFRPLEWAFPAKPTQRFFRPDWVLDLCFFMGQYLVWNGLIVWVLVAFRDAIPWAWMAGFRASLRMQPWWLQFLEMIVLSDLLIYWAHRLQHEVGFLWQFHKVHHSAEHLDWLAAHREHPFDTIYTVGLINLPAIVLGFPLSTIEGFIAFRGIWAIYIHSNVRLPIGPLRWLIGAPELHHWHHDLDRRAGNYANISPLMDLAFGTYNCPDHEPEAFGIDEKMSKNYVGQMIEPIVKWPSYQAAEKNDAAQ